MTRVDNIKARHAAYIRSYPPEMADECQFAASEFEDNAAGDIAYLLDRLTAADQLISAVSAWRKSSEAERHAATWAVMRAHSKCVEGE